MNYISDNNCRYCTNYKCRCADCFALIEKNGKWYCDEAENYCENIDECWEYEDRINEDCDMWSEEKEPDDFIEITKIWAIQDLGIEEYSDEWYQLMSI